MSADRVIDVLVVSDCEAKRQVLERLLSGDGLSVSAVGDGAGAIRQAQAWPPKVIFCDYQLPDQNGLDVLQALRREQGCEHAYFLLSGPNDGESLASQALNAGADDFLAQPFRHDEVLARVRVGLRFWKLHDQLRRAATADSLTGLCNHETLHRILEKEWSRARRYGHVIALVLIDLDFFKAINDTYGHLVGNDTLRAVADLLRHGVRDCDTVGRLGGEEFALILPESTAAQAQEVAQRLRLGIRETLWVSALGDHVLSASFGVADSEDPRIAGVAGLVDLADRALYLAKRRGRDQVARSDEVGEDAAWVADIRTDEIEALRRRLAILSARAKDVYVQSVASLLQTLNEKDPYTARHALNVAFYAQQLAEEVGVPAATIRGVYNAALLHDIGKVGIPDRILTKRTPLTTLDRRVLEQVPIIGTRIVDHLRILEAEVQIIRHQREHYDGSGYPDGLAGRQIPIGSRILLVADAFDAMTTDRVYRQRKPVERVVAEIEGLAGKQFDPDVVAALRRVLDRDGALWQQRIDETVRAMQMPNELELSVVDEIL